MTGAQAALPRVLRWLETLSALALTAALLIIGLRAGLSGAWLGWIVAALALPSALWLRAAFDRARLAQEDQGPGVVTVEEGRIAYFAPEDRQLVGGVVALEELFTVEAMELKYDRGLAWRLRPVDGPPLVIHLGAEGADALPEALSALPGFSMRQASKAFEAWGIGIRPIWRRGDKVVAFDPARFKGEHANGWLRRSA